MLFLPFLCVYGGLKFLWGTCDSRYGALSYIEKIRGSIRSPEKPVSES